MEIKGEEIVFDGDHLQAYKVYFINKKGQKRTWEAVRRKGTYGKIVAIFALTPDKEVIFVKQFRIPQKAYVVELPAGLADKEGEDAESLARRELREETGYEVKGRFETVLEGPFNSGKSDDEMIVFFGDGAEKAGEQNLDDVEEIEVIKIPLDTLVDFCTAKYPDFKVDIKILNVLPVLQKKGYI